MGSRSTTQVFGWGEPAVLLLPTWSIMPSRHWKLQLPDLARRHRVVAFDGRADRPAAPEAYRTAELMRQVRCPVLVVHGDKDAVRPHAVGARVAELAGGELVTIEGGGHAPHIRDPVKVNLLLRDFIRRSRP